MTRPMQLNKTAPRRHRTSSEVLFSFSCLVGLVGLVGGPFSCLVGPGNLHRNPLGPLCASTSQRTATARRTRTATGTRRSFSQPARRPRHISHAVGFSQPARRPRDPGKLSTECPSCAVALKVFHLLRCRGATLKQ